MTPRFREEALLFVGTLYSSESVYRSCLPVLGEAFGKVLFESPPLSWNYSEYYSEETGADLRRNFVFFSEIISTDVLAAAKVKTMEIERSFSRNGNRAINLDPGYISLAKVVLATRKNYSHRIHLGSSVFAELELIYRQGRFHPMPYSYRDYRDKGFVSEFTKARLLLKQTIDRLDN